MKIRLNEYGYTPNNYKLLVKSTGLTNADFYRKFNIPEQTFYTYYKGTRTMKWKAWQSLYEAVKAFNKDRA